MTDEEIKAFLEGISSNMQKAALVMENHQVAIEELDKAYKRLHEDAKIKTQLLLQQDEEIKYLQTEIEMLKADVAGRH